jgi:16S rRNA (guanine527-N7)-methyltransferase
MVTLHLLDSLSVLSHIKALSPKNLLDVGAGAGLPSIPLAICLPDLQVTAIDSVAKKASFMRQVKGELALSNLHVEVGRVEILTRVTKFDVIISRAFSEISLFVKLTKHLIGEHGQWLAMKGIVPVHELDHQDFKRAGVKQNKIEVLKVAELNAERHLIFLSADK